MKKVLVMLACLWSGQAHADAQSAMNAVDAIPGVLKSQVDSGGNMWVVVQNNPQTAWTLVAQNLCKIVIPHQARIFLVKIVDVASVGQKSKPADWTMIGAANCGNAR